MCAYQPLFLTFLESNEKHLAIKTAVHLASFGLSSLEVHASHTMAVNEVTVATAALVIAVVALLIAFGQLIQQLFSTADGYRRCQSSVIGDWWQLVRLRFRWYGSLTFEQWQC
jgi:hypothetical protein